MHQLMKVSALFVLAGFCTGCAPRNQQVPPLYYFGSTDRALYASKRQPSEKNTREFKKSLHEVIKYSRQQRMKVPPGIFAQLGYLYLQENKTDVAAVCFILEKHHYPESTVFMDRMINEIKAKKRGDERGKVDA